MNLIQSLYNRLIAYFKKEKWAYVKMFAIDDVTYERKKGKIFIHLFESDKGNRRIKSSSSFPSLEQRTIDDFVTSQDIYQEKIMRWENGRYDPEIPRFSEIGEEDTVNALKGSIK